jgi:prepilin-type N-terminal cleavage/methylation domain-containing protein
MKRSPQRSGFTLLELLIAIGLTSILMVSLFAAMDIYFKLQLDSHEEILRQQISRTLLRQMTRDIQSVVFVRKQTVDEGTGTTASGTSTGSGTSTTGGANSSAGSASGAGSGSGGSSGAGASGGASGTTGPTGTAGSTSSTTTGSDTTAAMLTYTSGLVGSATDLLLYISRPDRTLSYVDAQSLTSTSERTGDLMIVRYLVADTGASGLAATIAKRLAGTKSGPIGLVRITGDLYGMSTAVQTGEEESLTSVDKIDAEEVSHIAFSYYDGANWQETWDSGTQNGLPVAIEIMLTLRSAQSGDVNSGEESDPYALGETKHRMVVALPLAEPFVGETAL